MRTTLKLVVLMGGTSGEREVSLASGAQVARALREAGHEVIAVDTTRGILTDAEERRLLESAVREPPRPEQARDLLDTGDVAVLTSIAGFDDVDLVFPVLHGGAGEDGTLQALLDMARIPYVGSGRLGCTLSMDKEVTKRLLRDARIPTPEWTTHPAALDQIVERLGLPVIVKPPSGGSTLGLSLAHDLEELESAVANARIYEDRVLFERYVRGRELTVGVVAGAALPPGEIIPEHEIFDYACKYEPGLAQEIFPADLPPEISTRVQELALRVHDLLFLRDFSRVDFILDEEDGLWCLEANALPGMTANSLLPRGARAAGLSFPSLCDRIVRTALARLGH